MKNIVRILSVCLLTAGAAQAAVINLNLPAGGNHASGSSFSTSTNLYGATFDIQYTMNAFATSNSPAPFIRSSVGKIGVGSPTDLTVAHNASFDGDDGEQMSITGLSIINFNAGTSGLVEGDLSIAFESLSIADGTANPDGITVSFAGFGNTTVDITKPAIIDLTALSNFSSTSTSLFVEPDSTGATNRWSIDGIGVTVIPEPATLGLVVAAAGGVLFIRRRFMM